MADITREDVATLIQEEYSTLLLDTAAESSAAIAAFGTVPLGTKVTNAPVLLSLPEAQWVSESATDDEGRKPTSKIVWGNKQFIVEEVAVIVPIHEDTLEDATEDLVESITKLGGQALGKKLDQAVMFGIDKPASWLSPDLLTAAITAGSAFQVSNTPGASDLAGSIFQAAGAVADSGADPDALLSASGLKFRLANLRAADGSAVYTKTLSEAGGVSENIAGLDAAFVKNGAWDNSEALALIADKSRVKIGVRSDVQVKFLDQATVGGINLAERDMVAFRFKARYAYVLGNTINAAGVATQPVGAVIPTDAPAPAVPVLLSALPSAAAEGATVTVTGTGLAGVDAVTIGGVAGTDLNVSGNTLTFKVPEGSAGSAPIIASRGAVASEALPYTRGA